MLHQRTADSLRAGWDGLALVGRESIEGSELQGLKSDMQRVGVNPWAPSSSFIGSRY